MNQAKLNILRDTFEKRFDIERFLKFTREFFNEPYILRVLRNEKIWLEYTSSISAYYKIARYKDSDDNRILILAVELKQGSSVERARSMQRNFISKVLDGSDYEGAIVAFYTPDELNWRLSLVRLDYTLTSKGIELDLTPAKRYSYLVGENEPNHTAQAQLLEIFEDDKHNPTLEEIESAFSVEKVTKDFFNSYRDKYLDIKEYLEHNAAFINETKSLGLEPDKFAEQFSKKLMGQLAFLYFLQKKGWLGVRLLPEDRTLSQEEFKQIYKFQHQDARNVLIKGFKQDNDGNFKTTSAYLHELNEIEAGLLSNCFIDTKYNMPWGSGDRKFIRGLFEFCNNKTKLNFFNDYLEPFFYEALNKKRINHYYKRFNCKIPFLNGGLFEPLEGYHWRDVEFDIPNDIFSNSNEKGREADGILDVFDRYNFTINEDEPLDKEVAIDPEMLGKIFEDLLDVSDRKSKGAFYTPREIVHYMCQESLINYLVNKVEVPYDDMKEFILYGEMIKDSDLTYDVVRKGGELTIKSTIYNNILDIDQALENVKIADPAVGSGAFPMGMVNEIVRARNNITEYIIRVNKEGKLGKFYTEQQIRNIRSEYQLKLKTIKNCIHAVDIEASAVDIAKLRLWLSIVVEQEIDDYLKQEPHPLPNLDENIKVGNSLIDEFEGIELFDKSILYKDSNKPKDLDLSMQLSMLLDQSDILIGKMFTLQESYFSEDNELRKKELKLEIDNIRNDLIMYKLQRDGNVEGLKKYEDSLRKKTKPYFIWELEFAKVFKEKGGFDIVIGNPPYVGESSNKDIFRPIANTKFGSRYYQGKMDLFYFFFHKGLDIGNDGCEINYITTNYYLTAFGARNLRMDIKDRANIRRLINFNELKIFDSAQGQHNMITMLTKEKHINVKAEMITTKRQGKANPFILNKITRLNDEETIYKNISQDVIYDGVECYIRLSGVDKNSNDLLDIILNKILNGNKLLGELAEINQGVVSGCDYVSNRNIKKLQNNNGVQLGDGIYVLDIKNPRDNRVLDNLRESSGILRDFYKNSDIGKYYTSSKPSKMLLYYEGKLDLDNYPDVYSHLLRYKNILEDRLTTYNEKYHWTSLHRPRKESIFTKEKIVVPYRSKDNTFSYNDIEWFCRSDVYIITEKDKRYDLKYMLALLNSKLLYFWLYHRGKRKGKILELFQVPLSEIPIKYIDFNEQVEFIALVDKILEITQKEGFLKNIEDNMYVDKLAKDIDLMVYDLYGFTDKEIEYIEDLYENK